MELAIEMKDIVKTFGPVVANDRVNLYVKKSQIHGIIGENGAGKTTLMKQLYGMYKPDSGSIYIYGEQTDFNSPRDAIARKIGMVHQHFTLVPSMTVLENIILGRPPINNGFIDFKGARKLVQDICERYRFDLNLNEVTDYLPVGIKQRVEIIKAMYLGADVLIMDEPTSVLTPQEIAGLFEILVEMKNQGKSIILITHKLSEIMNVTEEVTVLRDGKVTGNVLTKETNETELARYMVQRDVLLRVIRNESRPRDILLNVKNVKCKNEEGVLVLDDVSLKVRQGEIVGIAGVQGNGQTELVEVITGINPDYIGNINICGKEAKPGDTPWNRREMGIGHIPEDRMETGFAPTATIEDNFLMSTYRKKGLHSKGFIFRKKASKQLMDCVKKFNIKIPDINTEGYSLSGGNIQKLIVAREYNLNPQVLVAAQPTSGVDIGATEFIHNKLLEIRDEGKAVLLVSNELSEILALSDRILVIFRGKIIGELSSDQADESKIGLLMAGIRNVEKGISEK